MTFYCLIGNKKTQSGLSLHPPPLSSHLKRGNCIRFPQWEASLLLGLRPVSRGRWVCEEARVWGIGKQRHLLPSASFHTRNDRLRCQSAPLSLFYWCGCLMSNKAIAIKPFDKVSEHIWLCVCCRVWVSYLHTLCTNMTSFSRCFRLF